MKYYKTDSRKISFREYYHLSNGKFVEAWLYKIFGIPMKLARGIPEPQPFRDNIVEAAVIPAGILAKLNSGILELKKIGFNEFWFYTVKASLLGGTGYGVNALHSGLQTAGKVIHVTYKHRESFLYGFISELNDGKVLATTNHKRQFNPPPGQIVVRDIDASPARLLELHQRKLTELSAHNPPRTIGNLDQLAALDEKTARISFDDKVTRGVWVEMTAIEVTALRLEKLPPPLPPGSG